MSLVHLHRHGEYSLLDGIGTGRQHAERARELGHDSLAVTDHGTMAGVLYHWVACEEELIKPIIGMEAYFRPDAKIHDKSNWEYWHLILLAKNLEGWNNLLRLTSRSNDPENFYRKPCVDLEMLRAHSAGLIGTSSCISGDVPKAILRGEDPEEKLRAFLDIFGDDFVLEIQPHKILEQEIVNMHLVGLARERGIPCIATADTHYVRKEHSDTHDVMVMISTNQSLGTRKAAEESGDEYMAFTESSFWLMSEEEMKELFVQNHPGLTSDEIASAIAMTQVIADRCELYEVSKASKIPKATKSKLEAERILRDWCNEGLERIGKVGDPVYTDRVDSELAVMRNRGVLDYFVIVGNMVRWAKDNGIRVGPGRGSGGGSLVLYLSRITGLDPIGYDLMFERFMSEYRKEMPDVDIDFQHTRRDEVKAYLKATWGEDHVVDVAAFSSFGMKAAIQSVARTQDTPYEVAMSVSKEIDALTIPNEDQKLEELLPMSEKLQQFERDYPDVWRHAVVLEGQIKGLSKHPAAVVLTDKPVSEYMPTMRAQGGEGVVTQWAERADFHVITQYGFLKIDCLSTDGLTVQQHAIDLIEEHEGVKVDFEDPNQFPELADPSLADPRVLKLFGTGPYLGIFQFQSKGITDMLRSIEPDTIDDLIATNALFRPGPIKSGIAWEYAKLKHGEMVAKDWPPAVRKFLDRTHGLIVYQEQVMQIVQELGGFDKNEAYLVFKAMTKWHASKARGVKGLEKIRPLQQKFVEGAMERAGMTKEAAEEVWEGITAMSFYSFNRSHSAAYAYQAYQDGWLKTYYPKYMYASLLTWERDKIPQLIREAKKMGTSVLPPDVNVSTDDFVVDSDKIRFGLAAVKNVGQKAVQHIMEVREDGPFSDYDDFMARITKRKCNSRVVKSLVACGAFDSMGMRDDVPPPERAKLEREMLGFALTRAGTLRPYEPVLEERVFTLAEVMALEEKEPVTVGGEIVEVKTRNTKKGTGTMAFAVIEYKGEDITLTFFPRKYDELKDLLIEGRGIVVKGRRGKEGDVVADAACDLQTLAESLKEA